MTTAASYTPPVIEYGGNLGTAEDSIRIASHEVSLSSNNTFAIKLDVDILACSGTKEYIEIVLGLIKSLSNKASIQKFEWVRENGMIVPRLVWQYIL